MFQPLVYDNQNKNQHKNKNLENRKQNRSNGLVHKPLFYRVIDFLNFPHH